MSTATTPGHDVPVPAGVDLVCHWEEAQRTIFGHDRTVTDSDLRVYPKATQVSSGAIDDGNVEVARGERCGFVLNSDQARELAAALLESADQIDRWAAERLGTGSP
jgi:hypothetical protein